jgi:hypothetical protein
MRENRESPGPTRDDSKDESRKRTESPWPRVPRDGKCGEGDPRDRAGQQSDLVRAGKVEDRKPAMHGHGQSDRSVVPTKPPNKAGQPAAEAVEGRGLAKENVVQQNTLRTQSRIGVPRALDRVRRVAIGNKKVHLWPDQRFDAMIQGKSRMR